MKNLIPLFVIVIVGLIVGIIATSTGSNYKSNSTKYTILNPTSTKPIYNVNYYYTSTTPFKKKEVVKMPILNEYSTPNYIPQLPDLKLPSYNSMIGNDIYRSTWNNLITISNPSSSTRYVTIHKTRDIATGVTIISYR